MSKELSTVTKSTSSEFKAVAWLLDQGYEVYKNVSYAGQVDVVIKKDNQFQEIDVKTVQLQHGQMFFSWKSYLTPEQMEREVRILFVYGDKVGWSRDYF